MADFESMTNFRAEDMPGNKDKKSDEGAKAESLITEPAPSAKEPAGPEDGADSAPAKSSGSKASPRGGRGKGSKTHADTLGDGEKETAAAPVASEQL